MYSLGEGLDYRDIEELCIHPIRQVLRIVDHSKILLKALFLAAARKVDEESREASVAVPCGSCIVAARTVGSN